MSAGQMRRGHAHWFIYPAPIGGESIIRCQCGENFGGFIAWADHASGRDLEKARAVSEGEGRPMSAPSPTPIMDKALKLIDELIELAEDCLTPERLEIERPLLDRARRFVARPIAPVTEGTEA